MQRDFEQGLRRFIVDWNATFPLDRAYRQKYGISFGSPEHLKVSQVALYVDHLESQMVEEYMQEAIEEEKMRKEVAEGRYIKDVTVSKADENKLFEKLRMSFSEIPEEDEN